MHLESVSHDLHSLDACASMAFCILSVTLMFSSVKVLSFVIIQKLKLIKNQVSRCCNNQHFGVYDLVLPASGGFHNIPDFN